jgi:hypothetical protein
VKAYRTIEVGVTRWQWQVLKASAKAWRDRDVEAHAAQLLYEVISEEGETPRAEFERPYPVPQRRRWQDWDWPRSVYDPARRHLAQFAYRWHPRRWWK